MKKSVALIPWMMKEIIVKNTSLMNELRKTGVLLINLGTPNSPDPKDVKRYLIEFLTDPDVIDSPWLWRQFLVRCLIVPQRYKQSAALYSSIWSSKGSPLYVHGKNVQLKLQERLGASFQVELAMRYQNPSIQSGLSRLLELKLDEIIVLPLFPQYAQATTGSIFKKIKSHLKLDAAAIPKIIFIQDFFQNPAFIDALCAIARRYPLDYYDHFVFSYHGLPENQIKKADRYSGCLQNAACCLTLHPQNYHCYAAQCYATTRALADKLSMPTGSYSICFQSRLGKAPWLQPYASNTLSQLGKQGKKRILVFCPSFVCDCLETLYEIGIEYSQEFKLHGGERLDLVEGLNDSPLWIKALEELIVK